MTGYRAAPLEHDVRAIVEVGNLSADPNQHSLAGEIRTRVKQPHDPEVLNAIRNYLRSRSERCGQQQTAARFGVSRYTLWRFLWTDHVSPRLIAAVTADVGDSIGRLRWATERLDDIGAQRQSGAARRRLTSADPEALEILCHTPLATVGELSAIIHLPANTIRERLKRLSNGGPSGTRTQDLRIKSPLLWPTELRAHSQSMTLLRLRTCRGAFGSVAR